MRGKGKEGKELQITETVETCLWIWEAILYMKISSLCMGLLEHAWGFTCMKLDITLPTPVHVEVFVSGK